MRFHLIAFFLFLAFHVSAQDPNATTTINGGVIRDLTLRTQAITQNGATSGQVLKWNGTNWAPGTGAPGSTLADGDYGDITVSSSGTVLNIDADVITAAEIATGAVATAEILNGTILMEDIGQNAATTGQVIKWNGTAWAPAADNSGGGLTDSDYGDITVSGGGSVWNIDADVVTATEIAADAVGSSEIAADAVTASEIATGAVATAEILNGTILMEDIGQNGATSDQVIKWNGTAWAPAADAGGNTDLSFSGASSPYTLASSTGTDVTLAQGGIVALSLSGSQLTISATEVDGSTSNELNTTFDVNTGNLRIIDAGGTLSVPVTTIAPVQAIAAGTGISIAGTSTITVTNTGDTDGSDDVLLTGNQTVAGTKTFSSAPVITGFTAGSVIFAGASSELVQDNAQLYYDDTNNRLGVGTNSPTYKFQINSGSSAGSINTLRAAGSSTGTGTTRQIYTEIINTNGNASESRKVALAMGGSAAAEQFILTVDGAGTGAQTFSIYDQPANVSAIAIDASNNVGIGFTGLAPTLSERLAINGGYLSMTNTAGIKDKDGDAGTSGQALVSLGAGAGLDWLSSGGDVSGAYNNLQIAADAVTATEIATGAVATAEILNGTILMEDIGQNGATSGQVIKWNGSAWAPAADNSGGGLSDSDYGDITVSAGGTVWNIDADVVTATEIATDAVGSSEIATSAVTTTEILDGTVAYADITNVAANSLFGNPTGSAATGTNVTLGAGLGFSAGTLINTGDTNGADDLTGSGSANRVAYWSGASALTSSADLQFNGSELGVGAAPATGFDLYVEGPTRTASSVEIRGSGSYELQGAASVELYNTVGANSWYMTNSLSGYQVRDGATVSLQLTTSEMLVNGYIKSLDLTSAATPTRLVGAESDGKFGQVTVGNGVEFNGNALRRSALTGDVTAAAGSNTTDIAADAVGSAEIATGAVETSEILNGTILMEDIGQNAATSGQVIKWNGTAWAPAADNTGSGAPGGSSGQVQYNNASAFDGAANVVMTSQEDLNLAEYTTTAPNTPGAGTTTIFSQEIVPEKNRLGWINEDGVVETPVASFRDNGTFYFQPVGNSTLVSGILWSNTTTGTLTAANVATTNYYTSQRRLGYQSAGTAGSTCGTRHNNAQFYLGDAAGRGGFLGTWRCGIGTNVSGSAFFVGFTSTLTAFTNGDPSALTNIICMAKDAGDSNMQIMHNDGSGTATKIDLGANFPANTSAADWYEVTFFAKPNSGAVIYKVTNKSSGNVATGTISTNLPSNTTLMGAQLWMCNRGTASAVQVELGRIIIECPNQ